MSQQIVFNSLVIGRCGMFYVLYCIYGLVGLYEHHYTDVIMSMMASQITSLRIVDSSVYSGAD